jgi:hypothetical protein
VDFSFFFCSAAFYSKSNSRSIRLEREPIGLAHLEFSFEPPWVVAEKVLKA